jgi:hypothetical protein
MTSGRGLMLARKNRSGIIAGWWQVWRHRNSERTRFTDNCTKMSSAFSADIKIHEQLGKMLNFHLEGARTNDQIRTW